MKEAASDYRRVLALEPQRTAIAAKLALVLHAMGDATAAQRTLTACIASAAKSSVEPYIALATIREQAGDVGGAIQACRDGLVHFEGDAVLQLHCAILHYQVREKTTTTSLMKKI